MARALARLHALSALAIAAALAVPAAAPVRAEMPDLAPLDRLLAAHVRRGTAHGIALAQVDYAAWGSDPDHARAVAALEAFDPARLAGREERLAFWINAYNLLAVKLVLDTGVTGSIKDAGSLFRPVWGRTAGRVGGREVSLGEVEHRTLRPMGEPRVHFAIVCASLSCPDLRPEAYRPERLDAQLDDQARAFLANPKKGMAGGPGVRISRIFDWFEEDFGGGVLAFLRRHTPDRETPVARVAGFLPYDWALNAAPAAGTTPESRP